MFLAFVINKSQQSKKIDETMYIMMTQKSILILVLSF